MIIGYICKHCQTVHDFVTGIVIKTDGGVVLDRFNVCNDCVEKIKEKFDDVGIVVEIGESKFIEGKLKSRLGK